jgi:nucleoside-diphosphate-sugar epimerase
MTKQICVTGASGRAGRVTVRELLSHGYTVVATDRVMPAEDLGVRPLLADLTDYGQAVEVLKDTDAVVHLANIPAPGIHTPATTFHANMTMNFNVFTAAAEAGLDRVVWASSETTLGLPFDVPPRYAPVDEDHYPVPTSTYALSKVASETIATHIADWSQIPFIGLRFSNHPGSRRLPELPLVLGRCPAAEMELVGIHRRARRCGGLQARAGGPRQGQRQLHHRRGGHGDEPAVSQPARRGIPGCRADQRCW